MKLGSESDPPWWALRDSAGVTAVEFQSHPARFWPPDVLRSNPIDGASIRGRDVVLEGKGALWMYAYAAERCARLGARSIAVYQPQLPGSPVPIFPLRDDGPGDGRPESTWCHVEDLGDGVALVAMRPPAHQGYWGPEILADLRGLSRRIEGRRAICLTGGAANWMCAAWAARAVELGIPEILYFGPSDGLIVLLSPEGDTGFCSMPPEGWAAALGFGGGGDGVALGAVGNPNCGKSVFCNALQRAIAAGGKMRSWKLDCDAASPTPSWYMYARRDGRRTEVDRIRRPQKLPWSHEMEDRVAEKLRNCKRYLQLVLADLPGGDMRADPPQPIPPHREVILREVDGFIVMKRPRGEGHDPAGENLWQRALEGHGLGERIVAVIESSDPQAAPSLEVTRQGPIWRGRAKGLDRERVDAFARLCCKPLQELAVAIVEECRGRRG